MHAAQSCTDSRVSDQVETVVAECGKCTKDDVGVGRLGEDVKVRPYAAGGLQGLQERFAGRHRHGPVLVAGPGDHSAITVITH